MKEATMLYRHPGPHEIHGGKFDYIVVDADDVPATVAQGWRRTTGEALDASKPKTVMAVNMDDNAPPTRIEMEMEAARLGLEYDGRIGDKKLAALIAAKHKG